MLSSRLLGAPCGALRFFLVLLSLYCFAASSIAKDAIIVKVTGSDFQTAHDGLVEAIESEGLVVGNVLPFRAMLARTVAGEGVIPYGEAEIVQFCSSVLAAELVREDPAQLTLCPLSIALYTLAGDTSDIRMAYRSPGGSTPGRRHAGSLLKRIVQRARELARMRW